MLLLFLRLRFRLLEALIYEPIYASFRNEYYRNNFMSNTDVRLVLFPTSILVLSPELSSHLTLCFLRIDNSEVKCAMWVEVRDEQNEKQEKYHFLISRIKCSIHL